MLGGGVFDLKPTTEFMVEEVVQRKVGSRLLRISTPLEQVRPQDVPSPSEARVDHMLLPHVSC